MTQSVDRPAVLRAVGLLIGAVGCATLAAWAWMIGRKDGQFVFVDSEYVVATVSSPLVLAAVAAAGIGALGVLVALLRDQRLRGAIGFCVGWLKSHPVWAVLLGGAFVVGAFDYYEVFVDAEARRWGRSYGRRMFMLREDLKTWLLFGSTIMTALAISAINPFDRCAAKSSRLGDSFVNKRRGWFALAFAAPVVLGGALCLFALDGVPHFSDALTYQMQGRIIADGRLSLESPQHPELWIHSLFFVTSEQHVDPATNLMAYDGSRFFGKYPIGWPTVLGLFDALRIGWLTNAVLAGLGALLTGLLAAQFAPRRVAVIAAVLVGLSPWTWFNGANFASHVASMVAVTGFLWLYLRAVRVSREDGAGLPWGAALCAGLFLGFGVLVRPFDAAMFALPAVLLTVWLLIKEPKKWLALGGLIAAGALCGVGVYLWSNAVTTGDPLISPYKLEGRWQADWDASPVSILGRLAFQWAELNGRAPGYGVGGMTVALLGLIVALRRGRLCGNPGLGLLLASSGLFFATAAMFLFTNVWWGPRWLMPMTPVLAILAAELVDTMLNAATGKKAVTGSESGPSPLRGRLGGGDQPPDSLANEPDSNDPAANHPPPAPPSREGGRKDPAPIEPAPIAPAQSAAASGKSEIPNPHSEIGPIFAAQLGLAILIAGFLVGCLLQYPGQWWAHRVAPPHNVSAAVWERVEEMGLENAVLAMPTSPPKGGPTAPLDARAGMVFMTAPFEENPVIVVRAIEGWRDKARESFPQRQLYELIADRDSKPGFVIRKVE